jgi:hypothetical protein
MIDETLKKIEHRIEQISTLGEEKKSELTALFSELKAEVNDLARTDREHAESIARFADLSAHEATRIRKDEALRRLSIEGLSTSVEGFEASHPRLSEVVNSICTTLSNLGI